MFTRTVSPATMCSNIWAFIRALQWFHVFFLSFNLPGAETAENISALLDHLLIGYDNRLRPDFTGKYGTGKTLFTISLH